MLTKKIKEMTSDFDMELIERLRNENLEQFYTLVRMHLSFIVDINTDDVDCSTDKPKQFRWNFHRKTKNSSQSNSNSNIRNIADNSSITEAGLLRLYELIDFLSKPENVTQEGIFRRTGSLSRQQELRNLLLTGSSLGLEESRFSVHDCASVLKGFLADLPQPLLMDQYYQTYCTLASQYPPSAEPSETKLLTALQLLLLLLTPSHRNFLDKLLRLLRLVADNEASNRMSPDTLATMFTPHLLCPRKLSPETFHADALSLSPVVSLMIRQQAVLSPPQQLLTDARNYLNNYDQKLNESVSDMSAAKTVYTFVDRNRTRAENESNPTDAALAQLYAHIQALPDSQHKRKLIKHFNRQNGYGTPIQIQRTGKVAGSRSFGDSIKRHIFNKGLLNKTPKKGSGTAINTIEEKSSKVKARFFDDTNKANVAHKNIVLKNLANKIASSESGDEASDSDVSNESTLSEGAICKSRKRSPKFVSEPNLSILDGNEETPKNTKKQARLFRSKILSASQNLNKKYQKKSSMVRGTPASCVSCFDEQDTASENDISSPNNKESCIQETPRKKEQVDFKVNYLTSTPGLCEVLPFEDECETPYRNFRRASMSPISKSTQKLSKAMQESIMTPRSRKPLIMTCEQRESLPETNANANKNEIDKSEVFRSISPKNDSDFVSSEDDMSRSSMFSDRSNISNNASTSRQKLQKARSMSIDDISLVRHSVRSLSQEKTNQIEEDLNTTLCGSDDGLLIPKIRTSHQVNENTDPKIKSLTEPFREYLLSRSVLTATPIDLSILNKSNDTDDKISDSLLYCLDGNNPSDLTSCINNLAVDKSDISLHGRSPLKNINGFVKNSMGNSPNRKRCASNSMKEEVASVSDNKKALVEIENVNSSKVIHYEIRETDL